MSRSLSCPRASPRASPLRCESAAPAFWQEARRTPWLDRRTWGVLARGHAGALARSCAHAGLYACLQVRYGAATCRRGTVAVDRLSWGLPPASAPCGGPGAIYSEPGRSEARVRANRQCRFNTRPISMARGRRQTIPSVGNGLRALTEDGLHVCQSKTGVTTQPSF